MPDRETKTLFLCPYLSMDEDTLCLVLEGQPYHPSAFQQEEYCITNNFRSCPFYSLSESSRIAAGCGMFGAGNSG